jgi:ankyrin repeat protein
MTTMDASLRPTAEALVSHISSVQDKDICYTRPCCFDGFHSDTTSWQGSDPGDDDIFETANTTSDLTTISSMETPTPSSEARNVQAIERRNIHDATPLSPDQLNGKNGEVQEIQPPIFRRDMIGVRTSTGSSLNSGEVSNLSPNASPPEEISDQSNIEQDSSLLSRITTPTASLPETNRPATGEMITTKVPPTGNSNPSEEIEKAFHESHERLERYLLRLKKTDSNWRSHLINLIEKPVVDSKGFNLLIVATNFKNALLASRVVDEVVCKNRKLINATTIFGNSALHYTALHGRSKMIRFLLNNGAELGARNARGTTALHIALRYKRSDAYEELVDRCLPEHINARDDRGRTPIHAASFGSSKKVIDRLVSTGAKVNATDNFGDTALRMAERRGNKAVIDVIQAHISKDPENNEPLPKVDYKSQHDQFAETIMAACSCEVCLMRKAVSTAIGQPLTIASTCPCPNHMKLFMRDTISSVSTIRRILAFCPCAGCVTAREYNDKNCPCGTPINRDYLPYDRSLETAPPFDPESPTLPPEFDGKPLPPYPGHKHYDRLIDKELKEQASTVSSQVMAAISLKILADAGFKGGRSYRKRPDLALKWVIDIERDYPDPTQVRKTVEILHECGASIDTLSGLWAILDVAARNQHLPLMQLALDKKATIDLIVPSDTRSITALGVAIRHNHALSARMLLKAGANVNTRTLDTLSTLLHECVRRYDMLGWHLPLLLAHGALPDIVDSDGNTPLHIAITKSHLHAVEILLECGADVSIANKARLDPLALAIQACDMDMVSALLLHGADVYAASNGYPSALFHALSASSNEIAGLLLAEYSLREDVHRLTSERQGALHCLAMSDKPNMHNLIDGLMARGCKIDAETQTGNTPLHLAAHRGKTYVVKKLVERGAIIHVQNHKGQTPLDLAQRMRYREIVECLGGTFKTSWWRR